MGDEPVPGLHEVLVECAKVSQWMESYIRGMGRDMQKLQERVVRLEKALKNHMVSEGEG